MEDSVKLNILQELIQINTVNGHEQPAAEYLSLQILSNGQAFVNLMRHFFSARSPFNDWKTVLIQYVARGIRGTVRNGKRQRLQRFDMTAAPGKRIDQPDQSPLA